MRRFVGSGQFYIKICDNQSQLLPKCIRPRRSEYNTPSHVQNDTFTSCDGDLQDVVGIQSVDGVSKYFFCFSVILVVTFLFLASTLSMPATLETPPPYSSHVPASSNCQTFQATPLVFVHCEFYFYILSCPSQFDLLLYIPDLRDSQGHWCWSIQLR